MTNRPIRRRRTLHELLVLSWLLRAGVIVLPLLLLAYEGANGLIRLTDAYLGDASPVLSELASAKAKRPVRIGAIRQDISLETLWTMYRRHDPAGTFALSADDIDIGTAKTTYLRNNGTTAVYDEPTITRSPVFIHVPRVTAYVSMPQILAGNYLSAVPQIEFDSPSVVLARDAAGEFNFMHVLPSNPNAKPARPFRTVINIKDGNLRLCDYDRAATPGQLSENELVNVNGDADLTAVSNYRFTASAVSKPGSVTTERVGSIHVDGSWGRVGLTDFPNEGPQQSSARFMLHVKAVHADVPYWFYYFLNAGLPDAANPSNKATFRIQRGKADVALTVAAPRPDVQDGPTPGIGITFDGRFAEAQMSTDYLPTPLTDGHGTLDYEDGTASFTADANVLGGPVAVAGTLWRLTKQGSTNTATDPELAINVHAPHVAGTRLVELVRGLMTGKPIPDQLQLGGDLAIDGLISGSVQDPVAVAHVAGVQGVWTNLLAVRDVTSDVTYSAGVLGLSSLTGTLEGGGAITGHTAVRLLARSTGATGPAGAAGDAQFAVRAVDVNVAEVPALQKTMTGAKAGLRTSGRATIDLVGMMADGRLSAASNVSADGVSIGAIDLPVARARVLLTRTPGGAVSLVVPEARIESAAGAISATADLTGAGRLTVSWAASALDLRQLADAYGIAGAKSGDIGGLVSASGIVTGSPSNPRLVIRDLSAINLRADITGSDGVPRRLALDSLRGTEIVGTRRGVNLQQPLVARRFPAMISVTGSVSDIESINGEKVDPRINLSASVRNLSFAEINRQLSVDVGRTAREKLLGGSRPAANNTQTSRAAPPGPSDVNAEIAIAGVHVFGPLSRPDVSGSAEFGSMLIGNYPLDGGSLDFSYDGSKQLTMLSNAILTANVGTITADATIEKDGNIDGHFHSDKLDLQKLAYLLRDGDSPTTTKTSGNFDSHVPLVTGEIGVTGKVNGTVSRIVVTADLPSSSLTLEGLALNDVKATGVKFTDNFEEQESRLEVGTLSLRHRADPAANDAADTSVEVTGAKVEFPRKIGRAGDVAVTVSGQTGDVAGLLTSLRRAYILRNDPTVTVGGAIRGAINVDHITVHGKLICRANSDGSPNYEFQGDGGDAVFSAKDVLIGRFSLPTVAGHAGLTGDRIELLSLVASSAGATYRAYGSFGMDKTIDAVVESNAVSIENLRPLPGFGNLPLTGDLDIAARITGTLDKPSLAATIYSGDAALLLSGIPATPTATQVYGPSVLIAGEKIGAAASGPIAAATASAAAAGPVTATMPLAPTRFPLDVLRASVQYDAGKDGLATLSISDALVKHLGASVNVSGSIPVNSAGADANRPISLTIEVPAFDLADVDGLFVQDQSAGSATPAPSRRPWWQFWSRKSKKPIAAKAAGIGGTLAMNMTLTGTIADPKLGGQLTLDHGRFTMPTRSNDDKDHINPITNVDARITFEGTSIHCDTFTVSLGGPNGKKGDYGTMSVTGDIGVGPLEPTEQGGRKRSNLADLLSPGTNSQASFREDLMSSSLAMNVSFKDFRPVIDDLFGFGEYLTGKANGNLIIKDTLQYPTVLAADNASPIHISDGELRVSSKVPDVTKTTGDFAIAPQFKIPIVIDGKAKISDGSIFRFDVNGNAEISGKLANAQGTSILSSDAGFAVKARLRVVGGVFDLPPIAHFQIQNTAPIGELGNSAATATSATTASNDTDGTIELRYGGPVPGIFVHNVTAVTHQYVRGGANSLSSFAKTVNGVFVESSQAPSATASSGTEYTITATINGAFNVVDNGVSGPDAVAYASNDQLVKFTSPGLQEGEIMALLGLQGEFAEATGGDTQAAANSVINRELYNSLLPQAFSPVTSGIQNALGLDDFSIAYDPSGYSQVFLARRLPGWFSRTVLQYTQQFQTRSSAQLTDGQPYLVSAAYDLFDLHKAWRLQPHVQIGVSTDDQHITTYFIRSSAAF